MTFIISHAGAVFPSLLDRMSAFSTAVLRSKLDSSPKTVKSILQKQVMFDIAGMPFPEQIHGLLRCVDGSRLVYGSDFPFTPIEGVVMLASVMEDGLDALFSEGQKDEIYAGNANRLLKL